MSGANLKALHEALAKELDLFTEPGSKVDRSFLEYFVTQNPEWFTDPQQGIDNIIAAVKWIEDEWDVIAEVYAHNDMRGDIALGIDYDYSYQEIIRLELQYFVNTQTKSSSFLQHLQETYPTLFRTGDYNFIIHNLEIVIKYFKDTPAALIILKDAYGKKGLDTDDNPLKIDYEYFKNIRIIEKPIPHEAEKAEMQRVSKELENIRKRTSVAMPPPPLPARFRRRIDFTEESANTNSASEPIKFTQAQPTATASKKVVNELLSLLAKNFPEVLPPQPPETASPSKRLKGV